MSLLQKLYWAAPYRVKCFMADCNARKEGRRRFSKDYESLKLEIAGRNDWPLERFREYQLERLQKLVTHCAAHVPYYRELFKGVGLEPGDIKSLDDIRGIPVLTKTLVREQGNDMVDERLDRKSLLMGHTSGTTGTPVHYYHNSREFSATFAYNAVRHWSVAGMERRVNRSISIGGSEVTSPNRRKPPFWVICSVWKQMYMSSYHLTPANIPYYVEALRRWQPEYIEGYPSAVAALAQLILETGQKPVPLKAAFTTAENLFDHQRKAIADAFGCQAFSQYGATEQVMYGAECLEGQMHLSPDHSIIEAVDPRGNPSPVGTVGDAIGTSLERFTQPLIRFDIGDRLALSDRTCSCGRLLPLIEKLDGRTDDGLVTRDGRRIPQIINFHVFSELHCVKEGQIIQDSLDDYRIKLVPGAGYTDAEGEKAKRLFLNRLGCQVNVQLEVVDEIERTGAGKFLAVMCNLTREGKAQARQGAK